MNAVLLTSTRVRGFRHASVIYQVIIVARNPKRKPGPGKDFWDIKIIYGGEVFFLWKNAHWLSNVLSVENIFWTFKEFQVCHAFLGNGSKEKKQTNCGMISQI